MSYSTVLAVAPGKRPKPLKELRNSHGWAPSIWKRLLLCHGYDEHWVTNDKGLNELWQRIESLPEWQQAPLVLTFDTGVIPCQAFDWAAEQLAEFDNRLPVSEGYMNHVPAVAELLREKPEAPLIGVYGTSVSDNPFDPWDYEKDEPGSGIPMDQMYVLDRHLSFIAEMFDPTGGGSGVREVT